MALITVTEASERHGLSPSHLRGLLAAGALKGQKFGKTWVVDERSLRAYLAKDRKPGPKPLDKRRRYRR